MAARGAALLGRLAQALGLRLFPMWVGDGLMAVFFALTWTDPTFFGASVPGDIGAVLGFEALAIHSTPFIGVTRLGILPRWFLLIYVPFALAIGLTVDTPVLLVLFLWHLAGGIWTDEQSLADFEVNIMRYTFVAVGGILIVFFVALVPLPGLGWVEGAVSSAYAAERGSGEYVYHALPAIGTLYFTWRAVWHIAWWHWERTGAVARMRAQLGKKSA